MKTLKKKYNKLKNTYTNSMSVFYYLYEVLLIIIGIFILYQFFTFKGSFKPNLSLVIILVIVLILKTIVIKLLQHYGKEFKSELMIESSKESKADFISTCVVLAVLMVTFLENYIPSL